MYRPSNINAYYDQNSGWNRMEKAWEMDEFVLDPTKITLFIGRTGVDGDTFKNRFLMDKYNIQINKTSRNTILLMTNIAENYRKLIPVGDWLQLVNLAAQSDKYINGIIEMESGPKRQRKARQAYERFLEIVIKDKLTLAQAA